MLILNSITVVMFCFVVIIVYPFLFNSAVTAIPILSIKLMDLAFAQVLGGMQATELGFRFHGDDHYELIFQRELQEAREQGVDPAELGVPDISDSGMYEVSCIGKCSQHRLSR